MGVRRGRKMIRTTGRRTGDTAHERGRGKIIMETLGWAYLPPSAGSHIMRRRLAVEPTLATA